MLMKTEQHPSLKVHFRATVRGYSDHITTVLRTTFMNELCSLAKAACSLLDTPWVLNGII